MPVGTGYSLYVYYRASTGDPWSVDGLAAGTVDVTGADLRAHQRYRPGHGHDQSGPGRQLSVSWTTNAAVASGQFGIWVVCREHLVRRQDRRRRRQAGYVDSVDLNVPVANGYRVYVYYRATQRRPLGHLRTRSGHGERDGALSHGRRGRASPQGVRPPFRVRVKHGAAPSFGTGWGTRAVGAGR